MLWNQFPLTMTYAVQHNTFNAVVWLGERNQNFRLNLRNCHGTAT